jgi:hypothetical protein
MALPLPGQEPARLDLERSRALSPRVESTANQRLANTIAEQLRQNGRLQHYNVAIDVQNGTAALTGTVTDPAQREEVMRTTRSVAGVERVSDQLALKAASSSPIQAVAAQTVPPVPETAPMPYRVPNGAPAPTTAEAVPMYQAPQPGFYDVNRPPMPPYAWPTYAPFNNYSRVAYPLAYPYQSWPFIGPCYPFPKVPLGWRKVKLEWEDGHWWFSKVGNPHDWWHLRYW